MFTHGWSQLWVGALEGPLSRNRGYISCILRVKFDRRCLVFIYFVNANLRLGNVAQEG